MKNTLILVLMLAGQALCAQAQKEISYWYPVVPDTLGLGKFKIVNTWNGHCISGDCKNGSGVFGSINSFWGSFYNVPIVKIALFKGNFSNEGNNFVGKMYQINVEYNKASDNQNNAYPLKSKKGRIDLTDEDQISPYLLYEGEAIAKFNASTKKFEDYLPQGRGFDPILLKEDSIQSTDAYYKDGYPYWGEIVFSDPSVLKHFKGYLSFTGEMLAGRLRYKNEQVYDGFFANSKPHGPGILTNTEGLKNSGIWFLGNLTEKRPFSFPESFFKIPVIDISNNISYTVGNTPQTGVMVGEANGGYKLIWSNHKLFFGLLAEGKANGYGYFYDALLPKRSGLNPTRGNIFIREGDFLNAKLDAGSETKRNFVNSDLNPYYTMLHAQQFTLEGAYTNKGRFVNDKLEGCVSKVQHGSSDQITIAQYKNGKLMQGWQAQLSLDNKVIYGVYICTLKEGYTTSLGNKSGITESDMSAALSDNEGCIDVPYEIKKKHLEMVRSVMEQQQALAINNAKIDSLTKLNRATGSLEEQDCNTRKKYLTVHQRLSYTALYGERAILLDYDCTQSMYVLAVRKKAAIYGNSYAPHYYTEIQLVDPLTFTRSFGTDAASYKVCPVCHGYPAGNQEYINETWTKKYVLGQSWYIQSDKKDRYTKVEICKRCKGEAFVR